MRAKVRSRDKTPAPTGPFMGAISVVNPENETMNVEFQAGLKRVRVLHPYLGISSWIRSIPDSGMSTLMQIRYDTKDPETLMYYNEASVPDQRIKRYRSDNPLEPYRPLSPGEHHIASRGNVESFYGHRSYKEERAGIARRWLDQDTAESGAKAPLHTLRLHQHDESSNKVGDEMRFGVVRRPKQGGAAGTFDWPDGVHASAAGFAKEYLRILKKGKGKGDPDFMIDYREGDVMDDQGKAIKGKVVTNELLARWIANGKQNDPVFWEVDDEGNIGLNVPQNASVGIKIEVKKTDITINLGRSFLLTAKEQFKVENKTTEFKTSDKTILDCPNINLGGSSPSDKVIKGSTYRQKESQMNDKLKTALKSLSQYIGMAGKMLSKVQAMKIPIAGAIAATVPIGMAGEMLSQAASSCDDMESAISSFEGSSGDYLSETTKVK